MGAERLVLGLLGRRQLALLPIEGNHHDAYPALALCADGGRDNDTYQFYFLRTRSTVAFLIVLAGEGAFPADVVIVADTGWENDMMRNDGRRTTAREFFEEVTKPLANSYGIDAAFVRAIDGDGNAKMAIPDDQRISNEKIEIDIPLYGSRGGRLMQSCTSKWKVGAIRQELRRRGATTAMTALGLHRSEAHRIKPSDVDWQQSCWPLCDIRQDAIKGIAPMGIGRTWDRASVYTAMERAGVPYLISSECDGCPHKDFARWQRTSPETIEQLAAFEAQFGGEFFLTKYRKPLREALALMRSDNEKGANLFDICDSGYCFV